MTPRWNATAAVWNDVSQVGRTFVRAVNPLPSPASCWHIVPPGGAAPLISVIIPTSDADRQGLLQRLLDQLAAQSLNQFEIFVIKGDTRQGRAINIAAALARGKYLVTLDDDTSLPDSNSLAKLADTMDRNPDIGMAGGNAVIPDDAIAFVRKAMIQIPRRSWEPVPCITDSDLVQHPCLIMRTDDFKSVGGENELIPRGLDPYLRQEIRKTGKRIVLIPDVNYSHLPPDTLKKLLGQFYRNGTQAAWVNRNYPQWVLETPPSHGNFKIRQPVIVRLFRLPLRTFCALLSGQWIWTACQCAYAAGFAWGITGFDSVRSRRQHQ